MKKHIYTRRELLGKLGGGLAGVAFADIMARQGLLGAAPAAMGPHFPAKCKAVISVFCYGGASHIDTFDPKPDAAIEIRGELGIAKTNTGERFSGVMPKTAALADKIAVIRSFGHGEAAHERGTHNMLTGYRPSPALIFPRSRR